MKKKLSLLYVLCLFNFCAISTQAAVLHFYSNPSVPQPLFHVTLEYKNYVYEADTRLGGHRIPLQQVYKLGDIRIEIPDALVNEAALASQMNLPFDFQFVWNNAKTYCSKLVGIALNMEPQPMSFAGTHYLKYYPEWIHRHDPGLSPDQIYEFGMVQGQIIYGKPLPPPKPLPAKSCRSLLK